MRAFPMGSDSVDWFRCVSALDCGVDEAFEVMDRPPADFSLKGDREPFHVRILEIEDTSGADISEEVRRELVVGENLRENFRREILHTNCNPKHSREIKLEIGGCLVVHSRRSRSD